MKKIFALVFSIFSLSSTNAQIKNVDLDVTMVYPKNTGGSDEIWSFKDTQIDVIIKNVGNTTLTADNVFKVGFELDGEQMLVKEKIITTFPPTFHTDSVYYYTGVTLAPGDTVHIFKIIKFGFPEVRNGTHYFCMYAVPDPNTNLFKDVNRANNAGCTVIKLYGGWPNAIDELTGLNNTLILIPNPASDEIRTEINLAKQNIVTLRIVDLSGRIVSEKDFGVLNAGIQQLSMSVSAIPQGFYTSQLLVGDKTFLGKVVISK